jgi:acetyl esterase/lipase
MRALQGFLVAVARRQADKPFDPVADRARGARMERFLKAARGVTETELELGGVPCRRFSSGAVTRGVFLHLHGGAYTGGSPVLGRLYTGMCQDGGPDVVSVDYRLAPEHPYPAALDDALAAYLGLLDSTSPERIVVGGESAGGNLVLALVQRLLAEGLPVPAAIVPLYPWTDLTQSSGSWRTNAGKDILSKQAIEQCAAAYAGGIALDDPQVSPAFGSFAGFPPALVHVGTSDSLLDDARDLARRMQEAGAQVTLREVPGGVHGFTLLPMPESRTVHDEITDFVLAALTDSSETERVT